MKKALEDRLAGLDANSEAQGNLLKQRERFQEQPKIITLTEAALKSKNLRTFHFTNYVKTANAEFFAELKQFTAETEAGNYELHLNKNYDLWEYSKEDDNLKTWKRERISNILGTPFDKLLVFKHKYKEWRIFCNPEPGTTRPGYPLAIMDPYHLMRPVSYKGRIPQEQARFKYRKRKTYTYCLSNLIKDKEAV
jgi:hypothetical protein